MLGDDIINLEESDPMLRIFIALAIVALAAAGAWAVGARGRCVTTGAVASGACADESCSPKSTAATVEGPGGKLTGRFDPAMSGVCRFACAAQAPFDAKDVVAQPGAVAGRLTRCPVSGVVFVVDQGRPHVRLGAEEYVTCCDRCTRKLVRDPRHSLRS